LQALKGRGCGCSPALFFFQDFGRPIVRLQIDMPGGQR